MPTRSPNKKAPQPTHQMQLLKKFKGPAVEYLFTDIDDTLTDQGQLHADAYQALWNLHDQGIAVIPVTGRPAGWCEMIARFWPVAGIVGENGALYFRYHQKKMLRYFVMDEATRTANRKKLDLLGREILKKVPRSAIASDQFCRLMDLAIDFCEDVPPLKERDVEKIVSIFENSGATAKVSSIHVNGWFGDYDKLSMCKTFVKRELKMNLDRHQGRFAFSGDSPNDEPMFAYFQNSFAVANIKNFTHKLKHQPRFVAHSEGGKGFVEIAAALLKTRAAADKVKG